MKVISDANEVKVRIVETGTVEVDAIGENKKKPAQLSRLFVKAEVPKALSAVGFGVVGLRATGQAGLL